MEKLLEEISFEADKNSGDIIEINGDYVQKRLGALSVNEDLSRYIL